MGRRIFRADTRTMRWRVGLMGFWSASWFACLAGKVLSGLQQPPYLALSGAQTAATAFANSMASPSAAKWQNISSGFVPNMWL